ncbi:alpha/beta hydrolase [uncultured Paraglaciecola sp.]|uniref:alpha/beta hydrolase n=1 Tax=uncultured Paraglaciecola sp. TaxID=1765024 RepID=UPI0026026F95|nr:alpha/beta hydrolase [uncultured Paraglaciecola sp.]
MMLSKKAIENSKKTQDEKVLRHQTSVGENVLRTASASSSGLGDGAEEVLSYIHSLPPAYNFEPAFVREYRKNPFEHDDVTQIMKQDITIPCEPLALAARIYRPVTEQTKLHPALIYFHGGGFVLGSIESYDKLLAQLCFQSNVVIISVAYRLAPETVFPGAVEDVQQATDWIAKNAKSLQLDATRLAIGGDSAGANLATVYCLSNKNRTDFKANFQLLIYPSIAGNETTPSRKEFSENLLLTKELLKWFHQHYISKEQENDPRFNVLNAEDYRFLPPTFVITAGFDPLRDEGQMYVNKLIESSVTVKHACYSDMFHGFINYGVLQQAKDAVAECALALKIAMNIK